MVDVNLLAVHDVAGTEDRSVADMPVKTGIQNGRMPYTPTNS
jgi:hypothetical protein